MCSPREKYGKGNYSLGQWMIDNLGEESIDKYWSKENSITPFEVSYGSKKIIYMICENVKYHNSYPTTPKTFTKGHGCSYCGNHHVHPKDSFAQWVIDNLGEDIFKNIWSDKNKVNPWNISHGSKKEIWISCIDVDYHPDYISNPNRITNPSNNTKSKCKCPYCDGKLIHPNDSFAQWAIDNVDENFLEKYWSNKNVIDPWGISHGTKQEIILICQVKDYHDEYTVTVNSFVNKGVRCNHCSRRKIHPLDSLGQFLIDEYGNDTISKIWSDKNTANIFNINPKSTTRYLWKCENNKHEDYSRDVFNSRCANFRCPMCVSERRESFLQEKVRLYIAENLNYKISHEHYTDIKCYNPDTKQKLLYDNEVTINENALIIEVHGEQHYSKCGIHDMISKSTGVTPQKALEYQQWKDQYKKEYALSQGYYYLEIPYWTDNDSEEWKRLIDDKINEILNNK